MKKLTMIAAIIFMLLEIPNAKTLRGPTAPNLVHGRVHGEYHLDFAYTGFMPVPGRHPEKRR